jgi:uncharacterized protein (DUF1684 family)
VTDHPAAGGDDNAGSPPDAAIADTLTLADWRRTVATLYADVRRMAESDVAAALAHWRETRERLYREHPQSPVPASKRPAFRAAHFDHDPRLRFTVRVEPVGAAATAGDDAALAGATPIDFGGADAGASSGAPARGDARANVSAAPVELPVSSGGVMAFRRFGAVTVPFPDGPRRLEVYWMEGYAGGLFLPFRDATNGHDTYGAGRYLLDAAKSADLGGDAVAGTLILDFNFAFQPSCAHDPKWACPLAPPANRLDIAVRAGERLG